MWGETNRKARWIKRHIRGDLQDGGRVRRGDHFPPHKSEIHPHVQQLLQNTY